MRETNRTCTTMIKLQIASMPFFPKTSRNNWPIGRARSELRRLSTDVSAKEAAMRVSHPRDAVAPTPTRMAMGAARAALVVSSDMCAAESSVDRVNVKSREKSRVH